MLTARGAEDDGRTTRVTQRIGEAELDLGAHEVREPSYVRRTLPR